MQIFMEINLPKRNAAIKARLYDKNGDYLCVSTDGRYQVVGPTLGSALDMFVDRVQGSEYLRKEQRRLSQ